MRLGGSRLTNIIAIAALVVSVGTAGVATWLAFRTNDLQNQANKLQSDANKFQVQQADLTLANSVLLAKASDYKVRNWPPSDHAQIIVNLNSRAIQDVTAELYLNSSDDLGPEVTIGDMPSCTEVNLQRQLPTSVKSDAKVSSISYATPDRVPWERIYYYYVAKYQTWIQAPLSKPLASPIPRGNQVPRATPTIPGVRALFGEIKVPRKEVVKLPRSACS